MTDIPEKCPHCGETLSRWSTPELSNWDYEYHLVCFNDDCPYYVKGWQWMRSKFQVNASYRYKFDPANKQSGPLPVWSKDALKNGVIEEDAEK